MQAINYYLVNNPIATFVRNPHVAVGVGVALGIGYELTRMSDNVQQFSFNGSNNSGCNMNNMAPGSGPWLTGQFLLAAAGGLLGTGGVLHLLLTADPKNQDVYESLKGGPKGGSNSKFSSASTTPNSSKRVLKVGDGSTAANKGGDAARKKEGVDAKGVDVDPNMGVDVNANNAERSSGGGNVPLDDGIH